MLTRLTQMIAKLIAAIAVPAFVWLGADEDQVGLVVEHGEIIAGAFVALIALAADLAMHRLATGSVFQPAGTKRPRSSASRLPLLGLALLPALLMGCHNPLQQPAENLVSTVFPEHRAYVQNDEELTQLDKDVRLELLNSFERTVDMGRDQPATIVPPVPPRE